MKFFPRSIRWKLQLWYGLILLVVLAAFGSVTNHLARVRRFRQIDQELQQRMSVLVAALRPGPRESREMGERERDREPGPGVPGPGGPGPDGERRRTPFPLRMRGG